MRSNQLKTSPRITAILLAVGATLAAVVPAWAHEGHRHDALGTVKSVSEHGMSLTTTEGKELSFDFTAETVVKRGADEVERSDIQAGERAVVTYEAEKDGNHAVEIKLGKKKP